MTYRRLLTLVCLSVVLPAGAWWLPGLASDQVNASSGASAASGDVWQRIAAEALHAYEDSSRPKNYPGEDRDILDAVFGLYSAKDDYSVEFMPDIPHAKGVTKEPHFLATYHDGGGNKATALNWLSTTPGAGGECAFFANLVAARAGRSLSLNYTNTTKGYTPRGDAAVAPVLAAPGAVRIGDIIMAAPNDWTRHTAIVVGLSEAGLTVVESNYGCREIVGMRDVSWKEVQDWIFCVVDLGSEGADYFGDLAGCRWAEPTIDLLASQSIVQGVAPGKYDPCGLVTRAQFAALMQRVFALTPTGQPVSFSDVRVGDWRYDPVRAIMPYMPPLTPERFAPDVPVDRETVATVLAVILSAKAELTLPDFNSAEMMLTTFYDASSITPAKRPAVAAIVDAGIMNGFADGTFQPKGFLTRAQVAMVLKGILELRGKLLRDIPAVTGPVAASIDSHSASPVATATGQTVTFQVCFSNTGSTGWTFYAALSLRRPDGSIVNVSPLISVSLSPGQLGSATWSYTADQAGDWDAAYGIWREPPQTTLLAPTGWLPDYFRAAGSAAMTVTARIDSHRASPTAVTIGQTVAFQICFTNTGNTAWTFYASLSLRRPDGSVVNVRPLIPVTLSPDQQEGTSWEYLMDQAGHWDAAYQIWKDSSQTTGLTATWWLLDNVNVSK